MLLRLPERLAYTVTRAVRVTVAGTIACSASSGEPSQPVDASADRHAEASADAFVEASAEATTDGSPEASTDACAAVTVDAASDGPYSDACPTAGQLPCLPQTSCASCPAYVCSPLDCPTAAGCAPII